MILSHLDYLYFIDHIVLLFILNLLYPIKTHDISLYDSLIALYFLSEFQFHGL